MRFGPFLLIALLLMIMRRRPDSFAAAARRHFFCRAFVYRRADGLKFRLPD